MVSSIERRIRLLDDAKHVGIVQEEGLVSSNIVCTLTAGRKETIDTSLPRLRILNSHDGSSTTT